ncbi:MAG: NAD-dependent DNA ligase LigA, partial [Muribaculaceae bacterium]|nr:NAD-dependent DNA ligase LigA [Muribaculaceae bacterium]
LTTIDDIGEKIAVSIVEYFANESNRAIIERLRTAGLQMSMPADDRPKSDILAGKTIVISGTFTHNSRDRYKELIELNGGKNSGSISRKTDYLLAGDNMGPAKLEKATSLGISIINEDTFLDMIKQ